MDRSQRVLDVMNANPVVLSPGQTLDQAWQIFCQHKISGAPVVNEDRVLVGVLSQVDLLRQAFSGRFLDFPDSTYCWGMPYDERSILGTSPDGLKQLTVEETMHQGAIAAAATDSVQEAVACMQKHHVHRLIIVDDQHSRHVVGILSAFDLLNLIVV